MMSLLDSETQQRVMDDLFQKRKIDPFMARRSVEFLALSFRISRQSIWSARRLGRDVQSLSPSENDDLRAYLEEADKFRPEQSRLSFKEIAKRHNVHATTVKRLWQRWIDREPLPRTKE